eukprot:2874717-Pyramimonas_sp.AAC.1
MAAGAAALALSKYCEHVSHEVLLREARQTRFLPPLLRALRCGHRPGRRARFARALSVEIRANGAIAAGCS